MNILISIGTLTLGGGEILPITLANELSKMGNNVTLHVLDNECDDLLRERINDKVKLLFTRKRLSFFKYVKDNQIEIINTHNTTNQKWICSIMPFIKVRHIATVHGMFEAIPLKKARRIIRKLDKNVHKWIYVAENSHVTLMHSNVQSNKMQKIHNAVVKPVKIIPQKLSVYGLPEDAFCITVVSRAVEKKCWPECIKVVTYARERSGLNIHLILAGIGPVYDILIKESLPDYIHLIGATNQPCSLYAASDVGLLLSIRECAPLSLIEMYYAGIPVIASDTGDVCEMMQLSDGQMTGILLPLLQSAEKIDIPKAADAIVTMLRDKQLYQQYKKNAIKKADSFDVTKLAEDYIEAYKY